MAELIVDLGPRSYPVWVEPGGLQGLGAAVASAVSCRRAVVVTDTTVGPLWAGAALASLAAAGFQARSIEIPAGEVNKTVATWAALVDDLLDLRVDRHTCVVALGGGVVGDVAGFAAATVLRGVPWVQVPTTLLAAVDSAIGGKTGVNHPLGKNLVGAFHQPSAVFAALHTLSTLPQRERRAGLGEVVKTALVEGTQALERVEALAAALVAGEAEATAEIVALCAATKARVVATDELDHGARAALNLGHTVGHALETELGHGTWLHGEAIAVGLVAELGWAARRGWCEERSLPGRVADLLDRLGLPTSAPSVSRSACVARMRLDKKVDGDKVVVPVCVRPGVIRRARVALDDLGEDLLSNGTP